MDIPTQRSHLIIKWIKSCHGNFDILIYSLLFDIDFKWPKFFFPAFKKKHEKIRKSENNLLKLFVTFWNYKIDVFRKEREYFTKLTKAIASKECKTKVSRLSSIYIPVIRVYL